MVPSRSRGRVVACRPSPSTSCPSAAEVARRYYHLFNNRALDEAERLVSSHAVFHYPHNKEHLIGRAGYRELARMWLTAFPDARFDVQTLLTDRRHSVRATLRGRGTHRGVLVLGSGLSIAPSGRLAELRLEQVFDIREGQIVDAWLRFDLEELLRVLA